MKEVIKNNLAINISSSFIGTVPRLLQDQGDNYSSILCFKLGYLRKFPRDIQEPSGHLPIQSIVGNLL